MSLSLIEKPKILVCVGSGGVGKTTVAACLGVLAAQQGKRVLVLTIDPAKRLAQTLGIEGTSDITKVTGQNFSGELSASVVDHKKTFDDFVARAASKSESVQKIYKNKLYQQLSTSLSGSQEFTALEKLYSAYESGKFDLIILDTPPTKHAIDFLQAPQRLSALFTDGVAKWFRDPEGKKSSLLSRVIQTGTRQVLKVLETLTGAGFIGELADFFNNIEQWQEKLLERTVNVQRMMVSKDTHFCLITAFDEAKLKEAQYFAREIEKGGYHLTGVILNRVFPFWLQNADKSQKQKGHSELERLYHEMSRYYQKKDIIFQQFEKTIPRKVEVYRIPDLMNDVSDLKDLIELGQIFMRSEVSRA